MIVHPGVQKHRDPQAELAPIRRALQENEDWLVDVVEHSRDLLCVHDLDGRLLMVNPAPARLLGYSVDEILQIPMREMLAPEVLPEFEAYLQDIQRTGESRGTMIVITRAGERRVWEYHNTLRTEGVASPIVRGIAHDVTERVRAENREQLANETLRKKVREGERTIQELKLFRSLVDQSTDSIEVVDPETLRFLDANETTCSQLGYTREELLALRVFDIDPVVTTQSVAEIVEQLRRGGSVEIESIHRRKDGSTFPVEVNMRQVSLDRKYIVATARDITERKRAEDRLKEFERVVEGLDDMILVVDREYRYVIANREFLKRRGLSREQLIGRSALDQLASEGMSPEGVALVKEKIDECLRGNVVQYELTYKYPTLGERRMALAYFPIEGPSEITRIACVVRDITEERKAEKSLKEYERVVETLEEMIAVVDRDYRFVIANRAFAKHRGMDKDQLAGRMLLDQLRLEGTSEEVIALIKQKIDECFEGKIVQYEMTFTYSRLGKRDLFMTYVPIEGPNGIDRIASVMLDITESKQAQRALKDSEEKFSKAFRQSPMALALTNANDNRYIEVNDTFEQVTGWHRDEVIGRTPFDIGLWVRPSERLEFTRRLLEDGYLRNVETAFRVRDGRILTVLLSLERIEVNGETCVITVAEDITERRKVEEALRGTVRQLCEVTEELRVAQERLSEEKLYLEESIDTELGFGEIIGRSGALTDVMQKVARVAPSDATVLLLGETGTGKELVARAIHRQSRRDGKSFIKLNCAAIPSGLLESELFGHEKGAFTGAIARKLGRLELADNGTVFLDEIGEIPLSLQPKLLRVLQDMEFERLGGIQTLKVNFRLLAATNRDLLQSVRKREFRSDLYYRLNVFPILIPPLRERREDIRPLVEHFVRKFSLQMKRDITSIPSRTMELLVRWEWPGNIRELENFVERSVILSSGSVLQVPLSELEKDPSQVLSDPPIQLRDKKRERIVQVLRECRGKLGGPDGAAARLGLKRTTLQSKLDQMGIKPASYREQAENRSLRPNPE